jgi:hypothetical protein
MRALTTEVLDQAAALFAIRRDWLDCATNQVYPLHDFYKQPERFAIFLDEMLERCACGVRGVLLAPNKISDRHEKTEESASSTGGPCISSLAVTGCGRFSQAHDVAN